MSIIFAADGDGLPSSEPPGLHTSSDANVSSVRRFVEDVDSKYGSAERIQSSGARTYSPDVDKLVAEGVRVADVLRVCLASDTCSLDSVCIASESDLEMSRLLTVLHRSTPYLLVMFDDGAQELMALSSFFMQALKLPAEEDQQRLLPDPAMYCRKIDENASLKHCLDLLLQGGSAGGRGSGGWEALAVTRGSAGSIIGKICLGDILQRVQDAVAVLQASQPMRLRAPASSRLVLPAVAFDLHVRPSGQLQV